MHQVSHLKNLENIISFMIILLYHSIKMFGYYLTNCLSLRDILHLLSIFTVYIMKLVRIFWCGKVIMFNEKGKWFSIRPFQYFVVNIPGMCWFCSLHGMKMLLYSQIVFISFAAWMETAIVPSGYYFQTLTQSSNCVRVAQPTFENYLKIVHSKSNLFFIHFLHNIIDLDDEMYNVKIKFTSICFCLPLS